MRRIRTLITVIAACGIGLAGASTHGASPAPATIAPALPGAGNESPAPGRLLVAKRSLQDPSFGESVVYLVEHDEAGTLGLIVNRPSGASLAEAIPGIEDEQTSAHRLYYGGPVGLPMILMLVRSDTAAEGMAHVADDVYISSDKRVLEELIETRKPASEVHFYVGYSGWGAGQLDFELRRDDWHVITTDTDAIFASDIDSLWDRLIERLEPPGIQVKSKGSASLLSPLKS